MAANKVVKANSSGEALLFFLRLAIRELVMMDITLSSVPHRNEALELHLNVLTSRVPSRVYDVNSLYSQN